MFTSDQEKDITASKCREREEVERFTSNKNFFHLNFASCVELGALVLFLILAKIRSEIDKKMDETERLRQKKLIYHINDYIKSEIFP